MVLHKIQKFKSYNARLYAYRDKTYRNKPLDKAELFNDYFYEQLSDASQYGIDIDWANDVTLNDIDFAIPRIQKLLSNINPNKAYGPDSWKNIKELSKKSSQTSFQIKL